MNDDAGRAGSRVTKNMFPDDAITKAAIALAFSPDGFLAVLLANERPSGALPHQDPESKQEHLLRFSADGTYLACLVPNSLSVYAVATYEMLIAWRSDDEVVVGHRKTGAVCWMKADGGFI